MLIGPSPRSDGNGRHETGVAEPEFGSTAIAGLFSPVVHAVDPVSTAAMLSGRHARFLSNHEIRSIEFHVSRDIDSMESSVIIPIAQRRSRDHSTSLCSISPKDLKTSAQFICGCAVCWAKVTRE